MTMFGHYVILFIYLSFTRVQLEFNSHLTGDPRSTEITDDNSPSGQLFPAQPTDPVRPMR